MRQVWFGVLLAATGCQAKPGAQNPVQTPPTAAGGSVRPIDAPGLHNAFQISDRVYSGSSPEGEPGFAALQQLGIKTIVSVDGARPDVESAGRHGLTYIHLPFGYDGIPRERVLALAKVAATVPGPVYVHCHHGKHRGPAAVAVMQLCGDPGWDADKAAVWLKTAGTDPRYAGLTSLPRSLVRPTAEELARTPGEFSAAAPVPDLARLMVEVDARWDHLKLTKAAGWVAPKDHPDIDPPHEAVQLGEHYREAARLDSVERRGSGFVKILDDADAAAKELEAALRATPVDKDRAGRAFARSAAACAACHDQFRDRPNDR